MNCKKCNNPLPEGAKFCGSCGAPVEEAPITDNPTPASETPTAPETPAPETPAAPETPTPEAPNAPTTPTDATTPSSFTPTETPAASPKSDKTLLIVLGVVGGIVVLVLLFFLIKALTTPQSNNPNEQQTISNIVSGTKTVTFGKYSVEISNDYLYDVYTEYGNSITIGDKDNTFELYIEAEDDEFDDYEEQKDYMQRILDGDSYASSRYEDLVVEIRKESGKELIYAAGTEDGDEYVGAMLRLIDVPGYTTNSLTNGYITFEMEVEEGQTAEGLYKKYIVPAINSIKYVGGQSSTDNN